MNIFEQFINSIYKSKLYKNIAETFSLSHLQNQINTTQNLVLTKNVSSVVVGQK